MTLLNVLKNQAPAACGQTENAAAARALRPRYDIRETDTQFQVEADLPGVDRAELQITVEDGVLEVQGARAQVVPDGFRPLGRSDDAAVYRLRLALGDEVNEERIVADLRDGVLRLTLPKVEEKQPRRIEVN